LAARKPIHKALGREGRGHCVNAALLVPVALALAACTAAIDNAATTVKQRSVFDKPDWAISTWDLPGAQQRATREVKPEDLIGADGLCAGATPQPPEIPISSQSFTSESPPAAPGSAPGGESLPAVTGGIALEMTECQVAQRAGLADRVEIGANERSERAVSLTYMRGERPGIYRFVSGRLVSIERGPEPPPEPKPAKPVKRAKAKPAKPANVVESAPLSAPTKITVGR
jgi:hypothetical protein